MCLITDNIPKPLGNPFQHPTDLDRLRELKAERARISVEISRIQRGIQRNIRYDRVSYSHKHNPNDPIPQLTP